MNVNSSFKLESGDCLEVLKSLESNSVDSLITDPPAGISFMGKDWDHHKGGRDSWIAWMSDVMSECLRVLKPGAHGLVWAIPRTSHWTATALENAGFEVRDVITHLFGSGFPKSLDISKAIDKAAGVERKAVPLVRCDGKTQHNKEGGGWKQSSEKYVHYPVMDTSTDDAKQWQGWGTALKPASEHWILVRKPCSEKTVASNVLKWGCGGLNIDGSRIEAVDAEALAKNWDRDQSTKAKNNNAGGMGLKAINLSDRAPTGRFPANLLLSHTLFCTDEACEDGCAVKELDGQSGSCKTGNIKAGTLQGFGGGANCYGEGRIPRQYKTDDATGASRFFYCAKASKRERGEGNTHPTVKSQKLMQYLITLITPPNGTVLDPFMGSGSTGVAAKNLGCNFVGIEKEKEYLEIAQKRILNLVGL